MRMDVQNNYRPYKESFPNSKETDPNIERVRTLKNDIQSATLTQDKAPKRSFDVAFLMMPDEKLRQKQSERQPKFPKQLFHNEQWEQKSKVYKQTDNYSENSEKSTDDDRIRVNNNISPTFSSDINIDVGIDEYQNKPMYYSDSENSERSQSRPNSNESAVRQPKFLQEYKNKIFDDPTLISMQSRARKYPEMSLKSAFTKVTNYNIRSPNPSASPDNLVYQNSASPPLFAASSPPTATFNKVPGFNNFITPAHLLNGNNFFKVQNVRPSSPNYPEARVLSQHAAPNFDKGVEYSEKQVDPKQTPISSTKMNFLRFRPDLSHLQAGTSYPFGVLNYQPLNQDFLKFPVPSVEPVNPLIANPAAAILSTLLPPTLAAFSLPAQNVCAKCSISFRMTSDLVYHMRTHHKSESISDPHRKKREEKLKCPVCNESFRERHHLTRHMTAHQDKEGDMDEVPLSTNFNKKSKQYFHDGSSRIHK